MNYISIEQAKCTSANFMYVWADEIKFISKLDKRTAVIIRQKKANQNKIITLSAKEYGLTVQEYYNAIRQAFIDSYGCTPVDALMTLAAGGSVAGKNWADGVYGVGALKNSTFTQNKSITIDPATGEIKKNGITVSQLSSAVYGKKGGKTVVTGYSYTDENGNTYTSQLHKASGVYYAGQYSTNSGVLQNSNGMNITAADASSIWESIASGLETFVNWLISLFTKNDKELLTAGNTIPQQTDGFVTETAGGGWLLAVAAAGILVSGGLKIGKKSKKNKK